MVTAKVWQRWSLGDKVLLRLDLYTAESYWPAVPDVNRLTTFHICKLIGMSFEKRVCWFHGMYVLYRDKHIIHLYEKPALIYEVEGHSSLTGGVHFD